MTITTNFAKGDIVWVIDRQTLLPTQKTIIKIQITITDDTVIQYQFENDYGLWYIQSQVFASQEELANSFQPL